MEYPSKWLLGGLAFSVALWWWRRMSLLESTRGLRNRNPGNIRHVPGQEWLGQIGVDNAGYVVFDTYEHGIRAMGRVLNSYARRGVTRMGDIIATWAPPTENDTAAYVASVSQRTGLAALDEVVDRPGLVAAIIYHENGINPFSLDFIQEGLDLA